jgi:hypothetical protein
MKFPLSGEVSPAAERFHQRQKNFAHSRNVSPALKSFTCHKRYSLIPDHFRLALMPIASCGILPLSK